MHKKSSRNIPLTTVKTSTCVAIGGWLDALLFSSVSMMSLFMPPTLTNPTISSHFIHYQDAMPFAVEENGYLYFISDVPHLMITVEELLISFI